MKFTSEQAPRRGGETTADDSTINMADLHPVPRGAIRRFRDHLNAVNAAAIAREARKPESDRTRLAVRHKNGRYCQRTRLYGDYLYNQDREKFMVDLREWLAAGQPK